MSESLIETPVETPVVPAEEIVEAAPVVPEVVAPPVEEEKTYVYQPTDDIGRALGGKQVIKYRTHDELVQKLTEQNTLVIRKLRESTRRQRLGISDDEGIPESAQRFDTPLEFNPRELKPEERVRFSRDLLDPEKFGEAVDTLFEATVGAKPQVIAQTLTEGKIELLRMKAKMESDSFVSTTPDYFPCKENFEAITNWMLKNNLAPVRDNFQMAYTKLSDAGVLLSAPPPVEAPAPAPAAPVELPVQPAPAPVEPPPAPAVPVVRVPSGLTREQASDAGPLRSPGDDIVYEHKGVKYTGLKAIDMMPSDEFARRVRSDRMFNQKYEALLKEQEQRRNRV